MLTRAALGRLTRVIDESVPLSWEYAGFSQFGEDGIIDFLCSKIHHPNRCFLDIGAGDGVMGNTALLALGKTYSGLMVEVNKARVAGAAKIFRDWNRNIHFSDKLINDANADEVLSGGYTKTPDVFSLDIDGNDYYVAKLLLEKGYRPRICVVEYNSALGPESKRTIVFQPGFFDYEQAHPSGFYYGVSVRGWRTLFEKFNYAFVSVESNGVNAFFIHRPDFDGAFVERI